MPGFNYGASKILVCLNPYASHYSKYPCGFGSKNPDSLIEQREDAIEVLENFDKEISALKDEGRFEEASDMLFDRGFIIEQRFKKIGINLSEDESESIRVVSIKPYWGYALRMGFSKGEELILINPSGDVFLFTE